MQAVQLTYGKIWQDSMPCISSFLPMTATYIFTNASSVSDCYHQDYLPHYLIKYSVKQGENTSDVYGTN